MIKEIYFITVWNEDEIYGESGIYRSEKEYNEEPTELEIIETLEKYKCEFAKVEKVLKKVN